MMTALMINCNNFVMKFNVIYVVIFNYLKVILLRLLKNILGKKFVLTTFEKKYSTPKIY